MNDLAFQGFNLGVRLDPDVLTELIYGGEQERDRSRDPKAQADYEHTCALRELQVYRLMRSIVSEYNQKSKGRRERLKLVEEGDGLVLEFVG
jgi:hypothetical protein